MDDIKQQVYDITNVMKFNKMRQKMGMKGSAYHNVHVTLGAPGTAKTTVATIMGQMMFEENLLSDNRMICINGAELKGKYVGHSAPDSVGGADSFGTEAIAQDIVNAIKKVGASFETENNKSFRLGFEAVAV